VSLLDLDYCTVNVLIQVSEKSLSLCLASVDSPEVHYTCWPVSSLRRARVLHLRSNAIASFNHDSRSLHQREKTAINMSDSQGQTIIIISVIFGALGVLALALRLFARVVVLGKIGLDDGEFALSICVA
jgi:hypothetical protein